MKRFSGIFAVAAALVLCLAATGCAGETGAEGNAITVSAAVTAQVTPDKASVGIDAVAEGSSSDAAKAAGEAVAGDIIGACRALGVAEADISNPKVTVSERKGSSVVQTSEIVDGYEDEWGNWIDVYGTTVTEGVTGYDAAIHFKVKSIDAAKLGDLVRDAKAAGATGFTDLAFKVGDREAAYEQALSEAVDAAHAKAESLAKASGVYVGRLVNLAEEPAAEFEGTVEGDASALSASDGASVEPASIPVAASVTASYAIS